MTIEIKAVSGFRKYPKITSPISLCTQLEVDISLQIILMDSLLADLNAAMEASLTPRDLHNVHILEYFSNICVLDRPCFILASLTGRNQISFLPYGVLKISGISGISGMIRCDCMSVFFCEDWRQHRYRWTAKVDWVECTSQCRSWLPSLSGSTGASRCYCR